jgi:hypothetical protein
MKTGAPEMSKEHGRAQDQSRRVGLVGSHDVFTDVTASRLEEGVFTSKVAAWNDTRSTDESWGYQHYRVYIKGALTTSDVGADVSVQVGLRH